MIGGTNVDNQSIKNNDPIQLQQMIIFLRAELAKYKSEINRLRDSDYYSLVLRLERENVQLTRRNKELSMDRLKLKRTLEREAKAYNEDIRRREIQRKKYISSIGALIKEKEHLRTENIGIQQTKKAIEDELLREEVAGKEKLAIENLDTLLNSFVKEMNEKMDTILKTILKKDDNHVQDNVVKALEEKDNEIDRLSVEVANLKNKNTSTFALASEKTSVSTEVFADLDAKIQKIITQSVDFEEQLDKKVRILDDLEQQLTQLALEISVKQSNNLKF